MSQIKLKHSLGNSSIIAAPSSNPASDVIFRLPNADGSDGQVLKTDGSGNLSFGAESNDFVKISTTTVSSAVAQVDFDIDAAIYTQALIFIEGMQLESDSNLYARFKVGGTIQTGNTYMAESVKKHGGGFDSSQYGGANQSYMYLTNNIGGDTNESFSGQFRLNLGSGTGMPMLTINTMYKDNASGYAVNFGSAGFQNFNTINGIRFYSGANIDAGKFTLYGMK